jgi:hypothetical protein
MFISCFLNDMILFFMIFYKLHCKNMFFSLPNLSELPISNFALFEIKNIRQPPIQWVPGALSLWVKRLGREADHSPPISAEVKE